MDHPNRDRLLEYYYREAGEQEMKTIQDHVNVCPECTRYLNALEQTSGILSRLREEAPTVCVFDLIIKAHDPVPERLKAQKTTGSLVPYLKIAGAVSAVMALVFFFHDRVTLLPFWQIVNNLWLFQKIGTFGLMIMAFFLVGSFITMAMAPVLLLNSEDQKKGYL